MSFAYRILTLCPNEKNSHTNRLANMPGPSNLDSPITEPVVDIDNAECSTK